MSRKSILTLEDSVNSRQRRYMSEAQILAAIDSARTKQRATEEMAARFREAHRTKLTQRLTEDDLREIEKLNWNQGFSPTDYKAISDHLYAKAERMEERIKILGQKLAAFRTEIFSFTTDRAVV